MQYLLSVGWGWGVNVMFREKRPENWGIGVRNKGGGYLEGGGLIFKGGGSYPSPHYDVISSMPV